MTNWWLIVLLVTFGLAWIAFLRDIYADWVKERDVSRLVVSLATLAFLIGLMYMAGVFTDLWDVYK